MMRQWFFVLLSTMPFLGAEESLYLLDRKARAFYSAYDYMKADSIYKELLSQYPLTDRQKARLLYNLGTVALAKEESKIASSQFGRIDPIQLTIPRYVSDLFFNQSMAYLKEAEKPSLLGSLQEQNFYIRKSLEALKKAREVDCLSYFQESSESVLECISTTMIETGSQRANICFSRLKKIQSDDRLKEVSTEIRLSLLDDILQTLVTNLASFQNVKEEAIDPSYSFFFHQQLRGLSQLWDEIKKQKHNTEEINSAHTYYDQGMQSLLNNRFLAAFESFTKAEQIIRALLGEGLGSARRLSQTIQLLLMKYSIGREELREFVDRLKAFKGSGEPKGLSESIEPILGALEKKAANFISQTDTEVLFYLRSLEAIIAQDERAHNKPETAEFVLKSALNSAESVLELLFLSELSSESFRSNLDTIRQIIDRQKVVLEQGSLFIPSFLQDEKKAFQEREPLLNHCFRLNHEKVVASFDRGFKSAQAVLYHLSSPPFNMQIIIVQQEEVVRNWRNALDYLLRDQLPNPQTLQSEDARSRIENNAENFGIIQEMFLEDRAKTEPIINGSNVW